MGFENRRRLFCVVAAAQLGLIAADGSAANKTWSAGSGSWNVGSNWNPVNVPAGGDAVFLTSGDGASRTVTYDNPTGALLFGNLLINATAGGTFALNQASFTYNGSAMILGTTGRGIYNNSGGTLNVDTMNMATAGASSGTFIQSAGIATIDTMNVGVFNPAVVQLSGGSINAVSVNLSQSGTGTITQTAGRFTISGTLSISDAVAGGTGVYELQGGTLQSAAVVINSGGGINHTGGTLNTPSLTLNSGGTFSVGFATEFVQVFNQNGGTIVSDFLIGSGNQLVYNSGSFPGRLDSFGRVIFNGDMTMGNGWRNRFGSTIDIQAARTITANGQGLSHGHGTLLLLGTLNTTDTFVGGDGVISSPRFEHQSGVHNVSNGLQIGSGFAAGTYNLAGGTLNVPAGAPAGALVGVTQPGLLNIVNGRANIATLSIGAGAAGTVNHTGMGDLFGTLLVVGDTTVGTYLQDNAGAAVNVSSIFVARNPSAAGSQYTLNNGTLSATKVSNNGTFTMTGGRAILAQSMGGDGTLIVSNNGSLTADVVQQGHVSLSGNARIFIRPSGNALGACVTPSVAFAEPAPDTFEGQWDLNDNSLALDYTGASPLPQIARYIKSGFAGGSWNATGLASAAAAASPVSARLGLGIAESSEVFSVFPSNFVGTQVDSTTVLVRCLLLGDANFDRSVTIADFARLATNFNTSGHWGRGDFNYDGTVGIADFALMAANFNATLASEPPRTATVPEVSGVLLVLAWPLRRPRRARKSLAIERVARR